MNLIPIDSPLTDQPTVNPQMVTLARQARGLTQSQLADRMGAVQGTISKIEAGVAPVSSRDLDLLSNALDFPSHFFLQFNRIDGPGISELYHDRKRKKVGAADLAKAYANATIRRMHVEVLMRSWETSNFRFPSFPADEFEANPEKIARTIRAQWELPIGPVFDITKTIEENGGVIISCRFGTRHIDGFSRWPQGLRPLFFINAELPPDRWRWTLAHELGHVVMHTGVDPSADNERQADAFAGEFLTPAKEIKPQLLNLSMYRLAALKRFWKVSMQALIMRAADLQVISPRQVQTMFAQLSKVGARLREPEDLDPPAEYPQFISRLVEFHKKNLGYSTSDLCQALALCENDLRSWYLPEEPKLRAVK